MVQPILPSLNAPPAFAQINQPALPLRSQTLHNNNNHAVDPQKLRRAQAESTRRLINTNWLHEQWNGPDWLPPDVRAGLASVGTQEPSDKVVSNLPGGALRVAVTDDLEKKTRTFRQGAPRPPPHLTGATSQAVLKALRLELQENNSQTDTQSRADSSDFYQDFPHDSPDFEDGPASLPASPLSSHNDFYDSRSTPAPADSSTILEPTAMADLEPEQPLPKKRTHDEFTQDSSNDQDWQLALEPEAVHQTATINHAGLKGEQRQVKKAHDTKHDYIQQMRQDLDAQFGPNEANTRHDSSRRRPSLLVDQMKREYLLRIDQTEEHCTNALAANADLERELEEARCVEDEARTRMDAAKARLAAIDHMWQAKLHQQEAAQTQRDYEQLESQIRQLEQQREILGEAQRAKTDKAALSASKAQDEDWAGILGVLQREDEDEE
ncbi:hypothetical protein ACHAPA_012141 [Fusarium lateritium]